MTDFSTRAMLEVEVSDRSLGEARDRIESELGSVRTSLTSDSGGLGVGSAATPTADGGRSVRDLLETEIELLGEIREEIENTGLSNASGGGGGGGSGGTILDALGIRALLGSAGVAGAGTVGAGAAATAAGYAADQAARKRIPDGIRQTLNQSSNFQSSALGSQITNPAELGLTIAEVAYSELSSRLAELNISLPEALMNFSWPGSPDWVGTLTSLDFQTPSWVDSLTSLSFSEPGWLSTLSDPQITEPGWVNDLTSFSVPSPGWVNDLQNLLGDGSGGGSAAASIWGLPPSDQRRGNEATRSRDQPQQEVNLETTVEAQIEDVSAMSGELQRAAEQALRNMLQSQDLIQ